MSLDQPESLDIDGSMYRFAIVASRFNQRYVDMLLERAVRTLVEADVDKEDIEVVRVPGANEIPFAVARLAEEGVADCIIALGLVMAGATSHHDVIAYSTAGAFHRVSSVLGAPIINGIITVNTQEQAEERCGPKMDRGREFALAALEMAEVASVFEDREADRLLALDEDEFGDEIDEDLPWRS